MRASAEFADIISSGGPLMRMAAAQLLSWDLVFALDSTCMYVPRDGPKNWLVACPQSKAINRKKRIYVGESS
jgi:hypothetical protein